MGVRLFSRARHLSAPMLLSYRDSLPRACIGLFFALHPASDPLDLDNYTCAHFRSLFLPRSQGVKMGG